jgi:hypothetical protein
MGPVGSYREDAEASTGEDGLCGIVEGKSATERGEPPASRLCPAAVVTTIGGSASANSAQCQKWPLRFGGGLAACVFYNSFPGKQLTRPRSVSGKSLVAMGVPIAGRFQDNE